MPQDRPESRRLLRLWKPSRSRRLLRWTGLSGKTLWDWLGLLVVPLAIAAIGFYFSAQQDVRQQIVESQRAQDAALQSYLDQMSTLLLDEGLRNTAEESEVRALAHARTLTVLSRTVERRPGLLRRIGIIRRPDNRIYIDNQQHKTAVLQFLVEAELIHSVGGKDNPTIRLNGADLRGVNILVRTAPGNADQSIADQSCNELINTDQLGTDLSCTDLSGTDLSYATLNTNLIDAYLNQAFLLQADLSGANLSGAHLNGAILYETDLSSAILSDAHLNEAVLKRANLRSTVLSGADLSGADLKDVRGITPEELNQQAASLKGATMPNGLEYEEWLNE